MVRSRAAGVLDLGNVGSSDHVVGQKWMAYFGVLSGAVGGGVWTQVAHQESGVAGLGKAAVVYLISNSRLSQICFNLLLKQKK